MTTPQIPIQNLYYLLLYAWNRLEEANTLRVNAELAVTPPELFARILIAGVQRLMRAGLERNYRTTEEELRGVRGRIDFGQTIARLLAPNGRLSVSFDELSQNHVNNQVLKATLRRVSTTAVLGQDLGHEVQKLLVAMGQVDDIRLERAHFSRAQVHRNNRMYGLLHDVCKLLFDCLLPEQESGRFQFRDFFRDEKLMWRIFQDFVFNFLRAHLPGSRVSNEAIKWDVIPSSAGRQELLPQMVTDVMVRTAGRTLVVDTKYYSEALASNWGAEKFHSAHMYQIFAYIKNLESRDGADGEADGMLLYPTVNSPLRESYRIGTHTITLATLDLSAAWPAISASLLDLVLRHQT